MSRSKDTAAIVTYGDHEMITPDNSKLRKTLRPALPGDDDPIARA